MKDWLRSFFGKDPPLSPDMPGKVQSIVKHERAVVGSTAAAVLGQHQASAWEIMIPPLFLYSLFRTRKSKELFINNCLFTKMLALEAAFHMVDRRQSRTAVLSQVEERTQKIMTSENKGLYSPSIQKKQMEEIDLLLDHFGRLLTADGRSHSTMVKNAYGTEEDYLRFLDCLGRAEKEVNAEALKTIQGAEIEEKTTREMEMAVQKIRRATAKEIFSSCR